MTHHQEGEAKDGDDQYAVFRNLKGCCGEHLLLAPYVFVDGSWT
jgi:hypothetical protein